MKNEIEVKNENMADKEKLLPDNEEKKKSSIFEKLSLYLFLN